MIMEYQKIRNLLKNTSNQSSRTKHWVVINGDSHGVNGTGSQIKFKNSMLRSSLYDYSDAYILVKETITIANTAAEGEDPNNRNKKVTVTSCAPFTDCISEINNKEIDHAKSIDAVMPMYNLIQYSDNYSKSFGSLWQNY